MADEMELDGCLDGDSDLQEGWAYPEVGELAGLTSGKFITKHEYTTDQGKPFPVAGAGGPIGWTDRANFTPPVMTLGRVGAAGVLNIYHTDAWVTDNCLVVLPDIAELFDFLGLFFRTVGWSDLHTGSSQPLITQTLVKTLPIPLPPLAEQKRIVDKVEELLAQVNAARDRLGKLPAILKRFRQSVLAAACSGRLTADWRENHPDVEHADGLLATLERPRVKRSDDIAPVVTTEDLILPDNWCLSSVGQLFEVSSGDAFKKKNYAESGIRLFQIANVGFGGTLWEQRHYLPQSFAHSHPKLMLKAGDIAIALNRPILGGTLKIARLSDDDLPAILYQRVGRLSPYDTRIADYFFLYSISDRMLQEVENRLQGSDQPYLNTSLVPAIPVPLPPLPEQEEIVRRVESLFTLADGIEKSLRAATIRTEKLTQAILAKAFRGELVPTEADLARKEARPYEPASALLARIRRERAEKDVSRPKRGNVRRAK